MKVYKTILICLFPLAVLLMFGGLAAGIMTRGDGGFNWACLMPLGLGTGAFSVTMMIVAVEIKKVWRPDT